MRDTLRQLLAAAAVLVMVAMGTWPLTGCTTLPVNLTTTTPQEVSTFAGAELSAAAVLRAADAWVRTGTTTAAQRASLRKATLAVQAEAGRLRAARDGGRSLTFEAFNSAVRAFLAARDGGAQP